VQDKIFTHEAAQILGVTPDRVRRMQGLKPERIGLVRLFDRREVEALARQREATRSPGADRAARGSSVVGMR
jgi:hypothetical protein